MFISKERGRLRVEVQDLVIPGQPFDAVRYQIKFYGATDAFIVSSGAEAFVQTSAEPPPKSSDNMILPISPLTKIFTRATSARTQFTLIEAREVRNGRCLSLRLSQDDINNITHNKSFVHFRGFIKYRDIFDKPRETQFSLVWKYFMGLDGILPGGGQWVETGPADSNGES